jgi:hypothetical protein
MLLQCILCCATLSLYFSPSYYIVSLLPDEEWNVTFYSLAAFTPPFAPWFITKAKEQIDFI